MKAKYHHALDSMYKLYRYGAEIEKKQLNAITAVTEELIRITTICAQFRDQSAAFDEIKGICDRALGVVSSAKVSIE